MFEIKINILADLMIFLVANLILRIYLHYFLEVCIISEEVDGGEETLLNCGLEESNYHSV